MPKTAALAAPFTGNLGLAAISPIAGVAGIVLAYVWTIAAAAMLDERRAGIVALSMTQLAQPTIGLNYAVLLIPALGWVTFTDATVCITFTGGAAAATSAGALPAATVALAQPAAAYPALSQPAGSFPATDHSSPRSPPPQDVNPKWPASPSRRPSPWFGTVSVSGGSSPATARRPTEHWLPAWAGRSP